MKKLISILDLSIDEIDKIFSIADIEKKLYQQYNNALGCSILPLPALINGTVISLTNNFVSISFIVLIATISQ